MKNVHKKMEQFSSELTPVYSFSQDYKKLHSMLILGFEAFCFVDEHTWVGNEEFTIPDRPAIIRRFEKYEIQIVSSGVQFGGVKRFQSKRGKEIDLFIKQCEGLNLRWVEPNSIH